MWLQRIHTIFAEQVRRGMTADLAAIDVEQGGAALVSQKRVQPVSKPLHGPGPGDALVIRQGRDQRADHGGIVDRQDALQKDKLQDDDEYR